MKRLVISPKWLWFGLGATALLLNVFVLSAASFSVIQVVTALIWLLLVPGWLITRLANIRTSNNWEQLCYIVGLSLLTNMVGGLAINTLLPLLGQPHPLSAVNLMLGTDIIWGTLLAAGLWFKRLTFAPLLVRFGKRSTSSALVTVMGLVIVIMSIGGAITLNNGGNNVLTWMALSLSVTLLGVMIAVRNRLYEGTIMTGLFCIGLALLLMTSLRGWFTTGHDIQREYLVFTATLAASHWDAGSLKDAYNACLSLTILPTIFTRLTGITEVYIYKTIYQLCFALVPVIVYLISRRYFSRFISILAAIYFMAFPTYFGDMPMLNRQEAAFLFIGLVFLTLFNTGWSVARRRWLMSILGVGVILSHYSTNYTMLVLFGLLVGLQYGLRGADRLGSIIRKRFKRGRSRASIIASSPVGLTVIAVLAIASFIWSSQLTHTGSNLPRVVAATLQTVATGLRGDTKSGDTSYSLFGAPQLTNQERLRQYLDTAVPTAHHEYPASAFTPSWELASPARQIETPSLPLTAVGEWLSGMNFPVADFNELLRQGSAKFLQLMVLLGIVLLFVVHPLRLPVSRDYRLLQICSVILLVAIVALPVLSTEYGLLRAFQQILILCGATIAVATIWIVPRRFVRLRTLFPASLALLFFASSTGIITTLLGGYPGQLHLANSGKYYEQYIEHATDRAAQDWLVHLLNTPGAANGVQSLIPTDRLAQALGNQKLRTLDIKTDIYPGVLLKGSYVLLGYSTVNHHTATVYYNGDILSYYYSDATLEADKDLIYSNDAARIYQ